jgi:folate-binding protein YgfZ
VGRFLASPRGLSLPTLFDLSARAKLRVSGRDAVRYLNGQITNDLGKATPTAAIQASILTAKGKLSAHVFVSQQSENVFLLDADPELRDDLFARLDRYIIADDVQLEDVTEGFSLFHSLGETKPALGGARIVAADRFGVAGWDCWCDPALKVETFGAEFDFCDDSCAEVLRIERGIPRWGRELTNEIIPVEANLEATSIDYAKGCYIGQEVISRMKMSGQTNKRLRGLVALENGSLEAGEALTDAGRECGWITSATKSERLCKQIGLGYVKRGFNAVGTQLSAGGGPVEVTQLPFL